MGFHGQSSAWLVKGISRLSQLEIDAGKDWGEKGIANIAHMVGGMQKGDLLMRGAAGIVVVSPNSIGNILTANGPLADVSFQAPA